MLRIDRPGIIKETNKDIYVHGVCTPGSTDSYCYALVEDEVGDLDEIPVCNITLVPKGGKGIAHWAVANKA